MLCDIRGNALRPFRDALKISLLRRQGRNDPWDRLEASSRAVPLPVRMGRTGIGCRDDAPPAGAAMTGEARSAGAGSGIEQLPPARREHGLPSRCRSKTVRPAQRRRNMVPQQCLP
ncbi:MAG: hypothetical protein DBY37_04155 [Desulfovibrionaceae bacterium]|nr:MAG: hypothetical protein DBY37_04155 [Desulfovibrionaceae bacterium]